MLRANKKTVSRLYFVRDGVRIACFRFVVQRGLPRVVRSTADVREAVKAKKMGALGRN